MSGQALRIIPRQVFDFSYLATSGTETRVLAGKIPTAGFTEAELLVRIHNVTISGGTPTIDVDVILDNSTDEDPANDFLGATAITGGTSTVDVNSTDGTANLVAITGSLGSAVAVRVVATQDAQNAETLVADISVDLILKSA